MLHAKFRHDWLYVYIVSKKNSNKFKSLLKHVFDKSLLKHVHVFDITNICIGQVTTKVSNRICPVIKTRIIMTLFVIESTFEDQHVYSAYCEKCSKFQLGFGRYNLIIIKSYINGELWMSNN